jgi:RimJ/RimL family protein N-acetyltransferase
VTKSFIPIDLSTERFVLRPIEPVGFARRTFHWTEDRQAFADLTWRTDGWTMWRWWRHLRKYARKDRICHGIWANGGTELIGLHIVGHERRSSNVTLGVLVADRSWWGKGVVAEVRAAILADCFERFGVHRATGWVNARNFASIYNYQRLGFTREAALRSNAVLMDGGRTDMLGFGLLRSEWLARQNTAKLQDETRS